MTGKSRARKPAENARPTIRSIAEVSGFSIGAVSSVLNNRHIERRISPDAVLKIRAAAAKLGYLPNLSARRLRRGVDVRNRLTLAVLTSFGAPLTLMNHFIVELHRASRDEGSGTEPFAVVIEMFEAGELCRMKDLLNGDHFNAAIITNTVPEDDRFLGRVQLPFPVVLINRQIPGYACVLEDTEAGTKAAQVLFEKGCRKLAVLWGRPLTQSTQTRVDRFIREVQVLTGSAPIEIVADELSEASASRAVRSALARGGEIDGLYSVTDALAHGGCHAIENFGKRIPTDIAVVGVGDDRASAFYHPEMAMVGVDVAEEARQAVNMLLESLWQPERPPGRAVIPVTEFSRAGLAE